MNIETLCQKINLQEEVKERVFNFAKNFDFTLVSNLLDTFKDYDKMSDSLIKLKGILGDDPDGIKILTCMLKASSDAYAIYQSKGISDDIYIATMKCYSRFINETYIMSGKLCFDRYWWTTRQAGCHLFRIGELEYEIKPDKKIDIHIPSDALFTPEKVDKSLEMAKKFFNKYYPELINLEFYCHSWLLDQQLEIMLDKDSNIISFQKRFDILDDGEPDQSVIQWVFHTVSTDYQSLPENTTLQRNMKKHLISGGVIRSTSGKLKQ